MFKDQFKAQFKELCAKRGISCDKAALEIGLSEETVTKWEESGRIPNVSTLIKIANYFDVPVKQFFTSASTGKCVRPFTLGFRVGYHEKEMENFQKNLKQRRLHLGLSYHDLAEKVLLTETELQNLETGVNGKISMCDLELLAYALDTSVSELLEWEDPGQGMQDPESGLQGLLSFLGYELETTEEPASNDPIREYELAELAQDDDWEDDNKPNILWIRYRKNNKCYQISWEQFHKMQDAVCDFVESIVQKTISQATEIEKPDTCYEVNFNAE